MMGTPEIPDSGAARQRHDAPVFQGDLVYPHDTERTGRFLAAIRAVDNEVASRCEQRIAQFEPGTRFSLKQLLNEEWTAHHNSPEERAERLGMSTVRTSVHYEVRNKNFLDLVVDRVQRLLKTARGAIGNLFGRNRNGSRG